MKAPTKPATRTAAEIAKPLNLSEPALKLLAPGMAVRGYFEALASKPELIEDAIKFLAGALPKREAVWWGFVCLKDALKTPPSESGAKALVEVEKWIRNPVEANRKLVAAAAEAAGRDNAPGCLASAAAFSSGSLAPPRQPVVKPAEHLTAIFLTAALVIVARTDVKNSGAIFTKFLAMGQQVSAGQLKW